MNKKRHCWVCIAWTGDGNEAECKKLYSSKPVTSKQALIRFKKKFPGQRDYTVQPRMNPPHGTIH